MSASLWAMDKSPVSRGGSTPFEIIPRLNANCLGIGAHRGALSCIGSPAK
jgi:hypothetical protein